VREKNLTRRAVLRSAMTCSKRACAKCAGLAADPTATTALRCCVRVRGHSCIPQAASPSARCGRRSVWTCW